jgi:hypothetical protein
MIHIKKGQVSMAEYIKEDISNVGHLKDPMIYSLNSGKRIRALIAAKEAGLAVEYIHTGLQVMFDMIQQNETRRKVPALHIKYGTVTASMVANLLLLRGLRYLSSFKVLVVTEITRLTENVIMDMNVLNLHLPPRAVMTQLRERVGLPFVIAFLTDLKDVNQDVIHDVKDIGESYGFCYYLANAPRELNAAATDSELFTENMTRAVTGFSRLKLWTPILRELTSYILAKFEKNNV